MAIPVQMSFGVQSREVKYCSLMAPNTVKVWWFFFKQYSLKVDVLKTTADKNDRFLSQT